jgi:hypothetical protein
MNESAGLEKEEAGLIAEPTNRLDDLWQASEGIFTSRSQSCAGLTSSTVARWGAGEAIPKAARGTASTPLRVQADWLTGRAGVHNL